MRRFIIALIVGMVLFVAMLAATVASASEDQVVTTTTTEETCVTIVDEEGYTIHHDAITHEVVVIDQEAIPSQHYSLKGNSGIDTDETPVFPADYWQANTTQEPAGHYNSADQPDGSSYDEGESGLHYTSAGSSGKRDWFYFQAAVAEVSHTETIVDQEAYDEVIPPVTHEECTPVEPPPVCEEDMPCWDCETMGNKECGPVVPPVVPPTTPPVKPPVVVPDTPEVGVPSTPADTL
jgi:hypothetical protein